MTATREFVEPSPPSDAAIRAYLTNRGRDAASSAQRASARRELAKLERARLDSLLGGRPPR